MRARALVIVLALALLASACGSLAGYPEAMNAWRAGRTEASLALVRAEYAHFRDDNDLAEAEVRRVVDEAREALSERPIVPQSGPPTAVPMEGAGPGALRDAIRGDLISGRITPILRATSVVANLRLAAHAPDLITVVYRREPVAADGGLLEGAGTALRSIAAKRAALDALEVLATPR
ncbi:MAG: hypothetical protein EP329_16780 [Deltaproteobacteria bacterium]|nr:MAG: hypothetical protein EP329_16780 [Deltaproteobacteria bacterium]